MKNFITLFIIGILILNFSNVIAQDIVKDIDGNEYKTVKIENQVWMTENLKTTKLNDGTFIPNITDNAQWIKLTTSGYCWFDNNEAKYKNNYGALYNWYAINTNKLCPVGWHVASEDDWIELLDNVGGDFQAGGKLKEKGVKNWIAPNTGATDEFGFNAMPNGDRSMEKGRFDVAKNGYNCFSSWWSATEKNTSKGWVRFMYFNAENVARFEQPKEYGFAVRCVKD